MMAAGAAPAVMKSIMLRALTLLAPFAVLAGIWHIASLQLPAYLVPSLDAVFWRTVSVIIDFSLFKDVLATAGRIMAGLAGAFLLGGIFAILMQKSKWIENFLAPILNFFQGIPALSWVVFAIIWFKHIEARILFIMVVTALPAFSFQILGALRAMSKDLVEMVLSFRPTRMKMFRVMVLPSILPEILTSWRVNIGNASRVVVVAELVGATGGVGYRLLEQQQLFDMAGALAWTLQLVFFVLITQKILNGIETWAFKYRAQSERSL